MDPSGVEKTVSRMADYLAAQNARGLAPASFDPDFDRLGRASIELVNEVTAKICTRHARQEAHLADLLEKLDSEEERAHQLERRIEQATNAVLEAELWVTRVADAIKTKLVRSGEIAKTTVAAA